MRPSQLRFDKSVETAKPVTAPSSLNLKGASETSSSENKGHNSAAYLGNPHSGGLPSSLKLERSPVVLPEVASGAPSAVVVGIGTDNATGLRRPSFLVAEPLPSGPSEPSRNEKVGVLSSLGAHPARRARLDGQRYEALAMERNLGGDVATNIAILMGLSGDDVLNYGDDAFKIMTEIQDGLMNVGRFDTSDVDRIVKLISPGFFDRLKGRSEKSRVDEVRQLLEKLETSDVPEQCRLTAQQLERRLCRARSIIKATLALMPLIQEIETEDALIMQAKLREDTMRTLSVRTETTEEQIKACALYGMSVTKAIQSIRQLVTDWMQSVNAKNIPNSQKCMEQIREALREVHG